jgi:hypothetical protein
MEFPHDTTYFQVTAWTDPVVDLIGFEVTSPYVELCWLPTLGPSATWMLRRLGSGLKAHPEGYPVDVAELAAALGLGANSAAGKSSPVVRTLKRLMMFGMARHGANGTVEVRRRIPPLALRQVHRLSPPLRQAHERILAAHRPVATAN